MTYFTDTNVFGYQYEAQKHANETHMLPLPPKAMGERNLEAIYNQFIKFIRDPVTGAIPPVYTAPEHMDAVKSVIDFMQAESATIENIDVYSIHYLFFIMKEHCCAIGEASKPSSIFVTNSHFERDFFEYEVGIACEFHEEKDRSKYCALSYVVRWGYMFGEYMCEDMAIIPKPGYHIPVNTKLKCITIEPELETKTDTKPAIEEPSVDALWEKRWANETQIISNEKTFNDDFPTLGARKRNTTVASTSYAAAAATSFKRENIQLTDDYDYELEASNPWSRGQQKKPQEPDSSFYSINFNSTRTNQTVLYDDEQNTEESMTNRRPTPTVAGRGKIY